MCGFYSVLSKKKKLINPNKIYNDLGHRGPDNTKIFQSKKKNFFFSIFFRLSILDLNNRSSQPFEFKNLVLLFNGEIYNYKEIRQHLIEKYNAVFYTTSDTEVLIQFLYYEKIANINMLQGMWSFLLYDKDKETIIACRDRFGEKGLFYYLKNNKLIFSSEIAAISKNEKVKDFNENYIKKYLFCTYRYLNSTNETLYKDIRSIKSGTYLQIDKNFKVKSKKYFVNNKIKIFKDNRKNILKKTKSLLLDSVSKCMRSDVKLAFCLSGGVDSTGLVSIAKKVLKKNIKTYTISTQDKKYNEFESVKKTIKKLGIKNHSWIHLNKKNFLKNLNKILEKRLVPLPTLTSYIQWNMMRKISRDGYKVVISGNGADEIFSGYYDHYLCFFNDKIDKNLKKREIKYWKKNISPLIRNKDFKNINYFKKNNYPKYLDQFDLSLYKNIYKFKQLKKFNFTEKKYDKSLLKNRMKNETFRESLPVILNEEDLNAMYFSIENRSPYLDKNLYEFLNKVSTKELINKGYTKSLLRDSLKGIAPNHVIKNYEKIGFNITIDEIIDFHSKEIINFLIKKSKIFKYIKRDKIIEMVSNSFNIDQNKNFLFKFLNLKIISDINK